MLLAAARWTSGCCRRVPHASAIQSPPTEEAERFLYGLIAECHRRHVPDAVLWAPPGEPPLLLPGSWKAAQLAM